MLLFIGAGASKSFDIPDTMGFISVFEKKANILQDEIYQKLKDSIPRQLFDTETLMTILHDLSKPEDELLNSIAPHTTRFLLKQGTEATYFIQDNQVKVACHNILREIKRIIRQTCLEKVAQNQQGIQRSYDIFFQALPSNIARSENSTDGSKMEYPQLAMFTTNYDTCIETYLNGRQVEFSKGKITKFGEDIFDGSIFINTRSNLDLVKLHGSIDLFVNERKIRFLAGAGAVDTSAITFLGKEYGPEFMVYPVESSSSIELLQSPFIELLYYFKQRLIDNKTWIIIGSTFRDLTVASIMNEVIMQKSKIDFPTVLHINPDATKINTYLLDKGYKSLSEVIEPINSCFMDASTEEKLKQHSMRG